MSKVGIAIAILMLVCIGSASSQKPPLTPATSAATTANAYRAVIDQYCVGCHNADDQGCRPRSGQDRSFQRCRQCRDMGKSRAEAPFRHDAPVFRAAPGAGDTRRHGLLAGNRSRQGRCGKRPTRAVRCFAVSIAPSMPTRFETCLRSMSMRPTFFPRTIRVTALTITPTFSVCLRFCWNATSQPRERSARLPWEIRPSARQARRFAFDRTLHRTGTSKACRLGTIGGMVAHTTLPLDGQYLIQVKYFRTNLGAMRRLGISPSGGDHRRWRTRSPRFIRRR